MPTSQGICVKWARESQDEQEGEALPHISQVNFGNIVRNARALCHSGEGFCVLNRLLLIELDVKNTFAYCSDSKSHTVHTGIARTLSWLCLLSFHMSVICRAGSVPADIIFPLSRVLCLLSRDPLGSCLTDTAFLEVCILKILTWLWGGGIYTLERCVLIVKYIS